MATVKEITTMCRAGHIQEAYELAKADMDISPTDSWTQKGLGWALYYKIKSDSETANYQSLLSNLEELRILDLLTVPEDNLIFEKVLFKVAGFVKNHVPQTMYDSYAKLSAIFSKLRDYNLDSSKGYSFLLQTFIKYDNWSEMIDFIEWWNLDKLTLEDYEPYRMDNGRTIMSLAERAFIAMSKALLKLNNPGRIEEFLPKLDDLIKEHPEMTYPGYFYGKLLLSLGSTEEEALQVIVPFARKKSSEFWVWQLISDVFVNDPDKQLACLLRAVHCRTKESFLGKVRIKLARLYIQRNMLSLAKYHIDKVTQCYLSNGWRLPYEVDCWVRQPWIKTVSSSDNSPIDYQTISDEILCNGSEEAVAVVTYVDDTTHRATLIYGKEKRLSHKLRFKVGPGAVLKINYINEPNGQTRVLSAGQTSFPLDLDYAKIVEGTVSKKEDNKFAFLKTENADFFISPNIVKRYNLQNNDCLKGLIVYDYNRKREKWEWTCVSTNKKQ